MSKIEKKKKKNFVYVCVCVCVCESTHKIECNADIKQI
jgi:hypothetical protein